MQNFNVLVKSQSPKKRKKLFNTQYQNHESVICIFGCCILYNNQIGRKFIMKIEQNDSGAIFTQYGEDKKITSRRLLKEIFEKHSDFKFYGWGFQENYTYITYLKYFKAIFESPEARKRAKVFTHMSKLLITRTPNQIKCHHQKMMNRHLAIDGIIEYLRLKIIKYLKCNPQAISEIEKINETCQKFFIRQSGFEERIRASLSHKKVRNSKRLKKGSNDVDGILVKCQDQEEEYEYGELKNSKIFNVGLKIEEPQSQSANS